MIRTLLYSLASLLLIAASLVLWHGRYMEVPDGIIELKLADPLVGWTPKPHNQYQIINQPEGPLLRLSRQKKSEKTPAIHAWFNPKPNVSAVLVRCDARWENVKAGELGYTITRIVSHMRTKGGKVIHPPDFGITSGTGDRDWHHSEAVLIVTREMQDLGLEISMLGDHGTLEVKNLEVTALRHRKWVPAALTATLAGWVTLFFCLIRTISPSIPAWRSLSSSIFIIAASWFFVFPQPKTLLKPIIGHFSIQKVAHQAPPTSTPKPKPKPSPSQTVEKPSEKPKKTEKTTTPTPEKPPTQPTLPTTEKPTEPTSSASTEATNRRSGLLYKFARSTARNFPLTHLVVFTLITLLILLITGDSRQWRLALALAILAELVPELVEHIGGWDDIMDVTQNMTGVALALYLWKKIPLLRRFHKTEPPKPLDPTPEHPDLLNQ